MTAITRKFAPIDQDTDRIVEEEANKWANELREATPVDTGRLQASARAEKVRQAVYKVGRLGNVPYGP